VIRREKVLAKNNSQESRIETGTKARNQLCEQERQRKGRLDKEAGGDM
jgi:hypothetical protein